MFRHVLCNWAQGSDQQQSRTWAYISDSEQCRASEIWVLKKREDIVNDTVDEVTDAPESEGKYEGRVSSR